MIVDHEVVVVPDSVAAVAAAAIAVGVEEVEVDTAVGQRRGPKVGYSSSRPVEL